LDNQEEAVVIEVVEAFEEVEVVVAAVVDEAEVVV
jgi:hypothetical protein